MTVHRVKLSDFKAKKQDEGAIEIELDDGTVLRVDPPEVWSDDVTVLAEKGDNVGASRALVGSNNYDLFVAAGGSAATLMAMILEIHGASVPELRASASS